MAKCRTCYGLCEVLIDAQGNIVDRLDDAILLVPCPDCHCGVEYCCDGLRAQPEPAREEAAPERDG